MMTTKTRPAARPLERDTKITLSAWEIENIRSLIADTQPAEGYTHSRVVNDRGYAYEWIGAVTAHLKYIIKAAEQEQP